jgi:SlyX protein
MTQVPNQPSAPPTDAALEHRLTELEIKASYADDLLDTLNAQVAQQQEQIDLLMREVSRLLQQGGDGGGMSTPRSPRDELPPHY